MIDTADKLAGLGDKVDALTRFNAYFAHATSYYSMVSDPTGGPAASKDPALAQAALAAAASALKTMEDLKKPDATTDEAWAKQRMQSQITLNGVMALASMNAK